MLSKIIFKVQLYFKFIFMNKLRFILTVTGMCTALFMVAGTIEAVNTYIYNQYKKIDYMNANIAMVRSGAPIELEDVIDKLENRQLSYSCTYYKKSNDLGNISYRYGGNSLNCNIRLIGTSNDFDKGYVYFCDEDSEYCCKTNVIYGMAFAGSDEPSCVIERSTSQIIFGKDNSVGEKVEFAINDTAYEFTVVGIIEDRPTTLESNLKINASVNSNRDIIVEREIFVPLSWFNLEYKNNARISSSIIFYLDEKNSDLELALIENSSYKTENAEIINYKRAVAELRETNGIIQNAVKIILVIVFIISGLIVMNTLFFSIKDRIRELGIRRALGAKSYDIIYQIVGEGVIYSVISYVFTVLLIAIFFAIISITFLKYFGIDFIISISKSTYIILFVLAIFEGILFSLLPAIYATKINTLKAIVFT